jgi:hypothetical protein
MSIWKCLPLPILFCLLSPLYSSVCFFQPPKGWTCALPKNMSPHVQIGFVSPKSSEFRPSINLAFETMEVSLKDYLKAVKQIHLSQPNTRWRDLGKFKFAAGEGRLTEISTRSAWGDIKMLQAIFVQEKTAYILTAASLKKDYIKEQRILLQSLQSLTFSPDLYDSLLQEEQKETFQQFFTSLNTPEEKSDSWKKQKWTSLQTLVENAGAQMGAHWQFLALQEGHKQIYTPSK